MSSGRRLVALAVATAILSVPDAADAQVSFHSCRKIQCARLSVPLDRTGHVPGSVSLYVERQKARRSPASGATLLLAGGPGQPSTLAYTGLGKKPYDEFATLTPTNDIVAFDPRGTGKSGLLRCPALERANIADAGAAAEQCANSLGAKRGFYRTTDAVDDIEAVRAALGVDKLTLVGVSYGTFVAQAYAARYPTHVERVLLDSVLDVSGWDPLYLDTFGAMPRVLRAMCRGSCGAFTDDPVDDVGRLVTRLARKRLTGKLTLANGHHRSYGLTRQELLITLVSTDLEIFGRSLFPGAVVSALKGDTAPILRLKHQAFQTEGGGSPHDFSTAEYAANTCEELPFPWTRFSDPATRAGQVFAAVQAIPATAFYPFDRATTAGNDFIRMCRRWPEASPSAYVGPPAGALPDVPVLMLSGEDDLRTPNETARRAAADWPHAQVLVVPDTGHSTLTTDLDDCTAKASRNFLLARPVAARCPHTGAFLPALPPSPLSLRELPAARGVKGLRGRAISGAEVTVFDVTLSWLSGAVALDKNVLHGGGLRGGTWSIKLTSKSGNLKLHELEYIPGVRVSGAMTGVGTKKEHTVLRLSGPRTPHGTLHFGRKLITGRLAGKPVRSRLPGGSAANVAAYAPAADRTALVREIRLRLEQLRRRLG